MNGAAFKSCRRIRYGQAGLQQLYRTRQGAASGGSSGQGKPSQHQLRSPACHASSDSAQSISQSIGKWRPVDDVVEQDAEETWSERLDRYVHISAGTASLLLLNEAIRRLFVANSVSLSPPLAGMILTVVALCTLKACGKQASAAVDSLMAFYQPLRDWVARWMPIFFVPSLIVLPRAAATIAQGDMVKMIGVTALGWLASILVATTILRTIRNTAHSDITTDEEWDTTPHPVNPFSKRHYLFWGAVNLIPLALAPALRNQFFLCGSAFLFASTIKGYLYGVALPHKLKAVLHPIIFCFLYSTGCMALWAYLTNMPYGDILEMYMPQGGGALGPGSVLMKMLAVVVLCDGQRVFLQRRIVRHHWVEIVGTIAASSLFSIFFTAFVAAKVGLAPLLAKSLVPRSITVALALPMTEALGGSASVTAALVCVTGLVGAALGQQLLDMMNVKDEISRGVAMGSSAHGLGASAIAASEPQALPFSAVTIAIMGTVSNLLLQVPAIKGAVLAMCGA